MLTIIQQPPIISLQGSPFLCQLTSNDFDLPNFKVLAEPLPGQFDILPLNQADAVTFDLSEYFESKLKIELKTDVQFLHENACLQFEIKFSEYYGNPPSVQNTISIFKSVLKGRIPRWQQRFYNKSFTGLSQRLAASIFLSWYPSQPKRVLPDQPELMYFINTGSLSPELLVDVFYTDGTVVEDHDPGYNLQVQLYQVASFPVGYEKLNLAALQPLKKVKSYKVKIKNTTFFREYKVDFFPYRDVRYIIFRNSLSGYDTLACTGEADHQTSIERLVTESLYDPEYPLRLNKRVQNTEETESVKINSGWLNANEKLWLNDLVISDDVFELAEGILCPILIKNTTLDTSERIYEPGSVEIEYERLYQKQ